MENVLICYCKQCVHCSYEGCDIPVVLINDTICQYFEKKGE